ncbi:MAG: TlpA family protein disulfide reductase [Myxococcales bacterium]|nr:TlpA family protein disulfide reductase [Myxococcales bacterium]
MLVSIALAVGCGSTTSVDSWTGAWRGVLDSPGGALPFGLVLERDGATLVNGPERIAVDARTDGDALLLDMPHYDARIEATRRSDGTLQGRWSKQRAGWVDELPFSASRGPAPRFGAGEPPATDLSGRWSVDFSSSDDPAVALFTAQSDGVVDGTFLTPLGDYRYIAGRLDGGRLRMSVFDGSHAFLFQATLSAEGGLSGDFWSGSRWHEQWTATRSEQATLPDAFALTRFDSATSLRTLSFPDLEGTPRTLDEPAFAGRARILQVFGTWCPNCADETAFLVELNQRYGPQGLSILGLAFEHTPDLKRSIRQVRRFQERHGASWPVLIAGVSDKEQASEQLPILDRVRAYPTTLFLRADGSVRAVHTGFAGPAAPDEHAAVRQRFVALVEELLGA